MLRNALGNMQTSQEYFTTIVYAKFGGQTECIMDNWKIVNWAVLSFGEVCSVVLILQVCKRNFSVWPFKQKLVNRYMSKIYNILVLIITLYQEFLTIKTFIYSCLRIKLYTTITKQMKEIKCKVLCLTSVVCCRKRSKSALESQ